MNKSIVAASLSAMLSVPALAQTSVTIYGVTDAGIAYYDNGVTTTRGIDSGLQSGSRLGFRGTEDLGAGLKAFFVLENGFTLDNGTLGQGGRVFGRQSLVGLSGGFGAIRIGRQYNPIRPALESIDPFGFGLAGNISNVFDPHGERADNTINYETPGFGGLSAQVAVSLGEVPGSSSAGRQWGFSAGYAGGPLRLVLAHHDRELLAGTPAVTPSGDSQTTMLGAVYDFKVIKAHAAYAVNKGESAAGARTIDSRDMMLGVSAPFGASAVMASYLRKSNKLAGNADARVWAVGYTYNLSKRTNLYASYARADNDAGARVGLGGSAAAATAGADPSTFNVGIRHRF